MVLLLHMDLKIVYLTTYDNLEYWKVKLDKVLLSTTEWLNVQCTLKHLIKVKLNKTFTDQNDIQFIK